MRSLPHAGGALRLYDTEFGGSVEPCHCLLQLSVGEQLYRGQAFHETFKCRLAVRLCDILKNPVDYRDPGRRRACSYSYAGKVLGAEVFDDAAHTLLTAVAALCAYAQLADREGDIVVNDDDVFGRYLIELSRLRDRLARVVHKGLRTQKKHPVLAYTGIGAQRFKLCTVELDAFLLFDAVESKKSEIVMIPVIFVARVAETGDDMRYREWAFRSALLLELLEYIENITHNGASFSAKN